MNRFIFILILLTFCICSRRCDNDYTLPPIEFELEIFPNSITISGELEIEAKIDPKVMEEIGKEDGAAVASFSLINIINGKKIDMFHKGSPPLYMKFDTSYLENSTYIISVEVRSRGRRGERTKMVEIRNCFLDKDGDGYGSDIDFNLCNVRKGGDCDDTNPLINPGEREIPDQKDQNCNGLIDEGTITFSKSVSGWITDLSIIENKLAFATLFPLEIFGEEKGYPAVYITNEKETRSISIDSGVYSKIKSYSVYGNFYLIIPQISGKIYSLSLTNFETLWVVDIGERIFSTPILYDINGDKVEDIIIVNEVGSVYSIDGKTGKILWKYETGETSSILLFENDIGKYILISTELGNIHILNTEGKAILIERVGKRKIFSWLSYPSAMEFGNFVVVPLADGYIYAIEKYYLPNKVKVAWKFRLCSRDCFITSLTNVNDNLLVSYVDHTSYFEPEFARLIGENILEDNLYYVSYVLIINKQGIKIGEFSSAGKTILSISPYEKNIFIGGLAGGLEKNIVDYLIEGRIRLNSQIIGEIRFFDLKREIFREEFVGGVLSPIYIIREKGQDKALFSASEIGMDRFYSKIYEIVLDIKGNT